MQSTVNEISFGQGSLQKAPSSATAPKCESPSDVVRKHPDPQLPVRDFKPCRALPTGALAKACNYALTLWQKLTRFLEYPELEVSNNLAENSMRPIAIGRKNWIHVGS